QSLRRAIERPSACATALSQGPGNRSEEPPGFRDSQLADKPPSVVHCSRSRFSVHWADSKFRTLFATESPRSCEFPHVMEDLHGIKLAVVISFLAPIQQDANKTDDSMSFRLDQLPINAFDFTLVAVLIFGLWTGRKHGMSQELISVLKWVTILVV